MTLLSPERRIRTLTLALSSLAACYVLLAFALEPLRGMAADQTDSSNTVSVTVAAGIAIDCNDGNADSNGNNNLLALGTIAEDGDTGVYNAARDYTCNVRTNNVAGYNLAWRVTTGSGGTSTGYMINQFEDVIAPFREGESDATTTPTAWNSTSVPATASAWGGRLSSTSDNFAQSPLTWDSDTATNEKWLKVATGSTVTIASADQESAQDGDDHHVGFRVEIGTSKVQPTGTYQSIVEFTATTK